MGVSRRYRRNPAAVNSYTFQDYLSTTGWVTLYGIKDEAAAYKLTTLPLGSQSLSTSFTDGGVGGLRGECAFDYEFLIPQLVKGEMYVTCTYIVNAIATQTATGYIKCRILHYDGTTETVIGTQQTAETITQPTDTSSEAQRTTFTFDVDKFFKTGHILRVEVELYLDSTTNSSVSLAHDGENRDLDLTNPTRVERSDFITYVPFDLKAIL